MSYADTYKNYSPDWWTPEPWMDWVKETLKTDDPFDPCPRHWQSHEYSGLEIDWGDKTYCNHPGARGSTKKWWSKAVSEYRYGIDLVWCAFSVEQLRHMKPSPFLMDGFLIMPRDRISFIWGGPTIYDANEKIVREHGQSCKSPGNWTVFWSTEAPAVPPTESVIIQTKRT